MRFRDLVESIQVNEDARIQHAEDLIFWEGSSGAMRAVQALESLTNKNYKNVTLKWDGSPAVIFGRDENGEFILTDKSGFTAKGYDGRSKSGDELAQMLLNRGGGKDREDPRRIAFVTRMRNVFDVFEKATPPDYRGYFKGDMLYFDTPPVENQNYVFKPNIVEYAVDMNSDLGQRIGASTAGVVIHRQVDPDGTEQPLQDPGIFLGNDLLVVPPITTEKPAQVDNALIKKLKKVIQKDAAGIDEFLNADKIKAMQLTDLPAILYTYTNSKVDTGMTDLGKDFITWLENTPRITDRKKEKLYVYIKENQQAFNTLWHAVSVIMKVKDNIISQFDQHASTVQQNIGGQSGGEGYVLAHPEGDIKLVPREVFSKANRAVQR